MTPAERDRLAAYGFDEAQISALHVLWGTDLIQTLLSANANSMRRAGHSPAETFDAVRHNIDLDALGACIWYGLSAHQVRLIKDSERATNNLYDRFFEGANGLEAISDSPMPPGFLAQVLLVAETPDDADRYFDRWHAAAAGNPLPRTDGTVDTTEVIEAELAIGCRIETDRMTDCDCPDAANG